MTLENQSLHLEIERLRGDLAEMMAERDKAKTESARLQVVADTFAESSIRGHQAICDGWWYLWEFGSANGRERSRDKALAAVRHAAGLDQLGRDDEAQHQGRRA